VSALRRTLIAAGLVLGSAAAYLAYHLVGPGRYAEFEDVQDRLRRMPGVELLDARGHEDVTFEIDGFTIEVEGRGVIEFGALERDSFEDAAHLFLQSIGGYEVIVVQEGYIGVFRADTNEPVRSTGWTYGIDVGREGPFARHFEFPMGRVQDVVERYEAICDELATWPVQPDYGTFRDENGTDYYYSVKDPSSEEAWIDPAELSGR
jgi:hypothetical protein